MPTKKGFQCLLVGLLFFALSCPANALNSAAPPLVLTEQEQVHLSQLGALRVITVPNCQPYSYRNTGVSLALLQRLCTAADISLQTVEAKDYADALSRFEQGEADLVAVKMAPHGDEDDLLPYLRAPLQSVYYKHTMLTEQSALSIAQVQSVSFSYAEKYAFVDEITLPSVYDCLNAVRGRQADLFLCDVYQLSVLSDSFAAQDLRMVNLPQREITIGFGLREDTDETLRSVLARTVDSFSTSELSRLLMEHTQYQAPGFQIVQFVYQNPFELLCAVVSLFFVILLCVFVSVRIRAGQHQELRGYEDSYRMLAETFGELGIEYDFLNDRFTFFGGRREHIDLPEVVEQAHQALNQRKLRISLTSEELDALLLNNAPGRSYEVELQCGLKEGSWNWFRMIYIVVCTSQSHRRPIRMIGCLVNIEDERQEKDRLLEIGRNDQLTGLLNRASAEQEIANILDSDDGQKVLLFLDVDCFKGFNDHYGHSCGDAVLIALGGAMRAAFPRDAILCRWGGDEFLALVTRDSALPHQLHAGLEHLQAAMQAFSYLGRTLPVTLSAGGVGVRGSTCFQSLFELADAALYEVKNNGRNHFHILYPQDIPASPSVKELP